MNGVIKKLEDLPKGCAFIVDDTAFLDANGNVIDSYTEIQRLDDYRPRETHLVARAVGAN